jgi:hypothetical protein
MRFNIYYKELGGHTHMRVFVNGGKAGDLCLTNEEFAIFRRMSTFINFTPEE